MLNIQLDRTTPVPLHFQVREQIRALIVSGRLSKDASLPPEDQIAKRLNVSRATIRQAMGQLVNEGLIERRRGLGTFITQHLDVQPVDVQYRFDIPTEIGSVDVRIDVSQPDVVPSNVRRQFESAAIISECLRCHLIDGMPVQLDVMWVPFAIPQASWGVVANDHALYEWIEEQAGEPLSKGEEEVFAGTLDRTYGERFGMRFDQPMLTLTRMSHTARQLVELRTSYFVSGGPALRSMLSREQLMRASAH